MALLSRLNIASGQRFDITDLARIESALTSDFLQLTKNYFTSDQSFIVKGFTISPTVIGTNAVQIDIDFNSAMVWHSNSANADSSGVFIGPASGATKTVSISNAPNATNYVYCDFTTFTGANAPRAFWSVTANNNQGGEFIASIDTARFLDVEFNSVTTSGSVPSTAFMVAIITTDGSGSILSLTDARNLYFRIGTGGISPDPNAVFAWPQGRTENSNTSTSSAENPFYGADKGLDSFRTWMEAIMESIREIKGTPYWYTNNGSNINDLYFDSASSFISGVGTITHVQGFPGRLSWTNNMFVKSVHGRLSLEIPASESYKTLADQDVMYLNIARNYLFNNGSTVFTFNSSSSTITTTVAGAFQNALDPISGAIKQAFIGDWIKVVSDNFSYWSQITDYSVNGGISFVGASIGSAIPNTANAVKIFSGLSNYPGASVSNVQAHYYQGYYTSGSPSSVNPGNLDVAQRSAILESSNHFWIAVRDDNGGSPEIYLRQFGELEEGEERKINDEIPQAIKDFMGTPDESTSLPDYSDHSGGSLRSGVAAALENGMINYSSTDIQWDATAGTITFSDDIMIRAMNDTFTYILPSSESPMSISASGNLIYATIDRVGTILVISTANSNLFQDQSVLPLSSSALNNIPLFFRQGDFLYGPDNTLWEDTDNHPIGSAGSTITPVSSDISITEEIPTGTINGINTTFTVSGMPTTSQDLLVLLDGIYQRPSTDYTFSSPTITFSVPPATGRDLWVYYNTGSQSFAQEVPTGTVDGINTIFATSVAPGSSNNILVFLDGLVQQENIDWLLSGSNVNFMVAPDSGQTVDVFYLFNANDINQQQVSGVVDGSNVTFNISSEVQNNSLYLLVDGLYYRPTTDYSIAGTTITFVTAPTAGQVINAYYQAPPGSVSGSLQDAYNFGSTITVTNANGPFKVKNSGIDPISGKIAVFEGDIDVTGMIDPIGIAFTQPSGGQITAMPEKSIYWDGTDMMVKDGSGNTIQVTAAGAVNGGGGSSSTLTLTNNTGSMIPAATPVVIDSADGTIKPASVDTLANSLVDGVTLAAINDGSSGLVQISGKTSGNLFSSFSAGDILYLDKTAGMLTATRPEENVDGFALGDHVFLVGEVILEGSDKNLMFKKHYIGDV